MTKRILLQDAAAADVRTYARLVLGLENINDKDNNATMHAKIEEAVGVLPEYIMVPEIGGTSAPAVPSAMTSGSIRPIMKADGTPRLDADGNEMMEQRVKINATGGKGGDRPVPVSVNGSLMLVPREKDVWIPVAHAEVLRNAVEFTYPEYDPEENGGRGGLGQRREVHSYPGSY